LVLAACTGASGSDAGSQPASSPAASSGQGLVVQVASYDLAPGGPDRFIAGVLTPDKTKGLNFGNVQMRFSFLGKDMASAAPSSGPTATASYLPVPGKGPAEDRSRPTWLAPADGVGVYETDVAFDRPGFWQVEVTADVAGKGSMSGTGAFQVLPEHLVPTAGDQAIPVQNLTMSDVGRVPKPAIDSRAASGATTAAPSAPAGATGPSTEPAAAGGETASAAPASGQPSSEAGDAAGSGTIPDPELHQTPVAKALKADKPTVLLFSTPVYCVSQFCGPVTQTIAELEREYGEKAAFIHVEVWRDYDNTELNTAFDKWVNKNSNGHEPWVFTIGADGKVAARWDNVPDRAEIESWLQGLPG
jgi:hypothetical protein